LRDERGRLTVEWQVVSFEHGVKRLTLDWTETWVAPNAADAARRGYGRELIERVLPHSLGAITRYELKDTSVRCTIDVPLTRRGAPA
jgi:two-component sensor histidine kinase